MHTLTPTFTEVHMIGNDRRTSKTHQFTENYKPVRQSVIYTWQNEKEMGNKNGRLVAIGNSYLRVFLKCGCLREKEKKCGGNTQYLDGDFHHAAMLVRCHGYDCVSLLSASTPNFRKERTGGGNNTDRKQCVRN